MTFPVLSRIMVASAISLAVAGVAHAADKWGSFPVQEIKNGTPTDATYSPLDQASKKWNICVLFPHMKDSFWVAAAYGITEEAKRLGVKVTILEAGGYDKLPKQISQWDDCVAAGAQAVVTGVISEAGMAPKFKEGLAKGIPQISIINAVIDAPMTARVRSEFDALGRASGEYLVKKQGGKPGEAVAFPGPQGSGWAEGYAKGFKQALGGSSIKLDAEKYGDTGVSVQLRLVEDAIQAFPGMSIIWGTAPTAEAAIQALDQAGMSKKVSVIASYENQEMLDATKSGKILGFASQYAVVQSKMGIDLAVRALEKKTLAPDLRIKPIMVTKDTISSIKMTDVLAPKGWRPIYKVE